MKKLFLAASIVACCFQAVASDIPQGLWLQTYGSLGGNKCTNCTLKLKNITPHIIELKSNKGWRGYAHHDKATDAYEGASEWEAGQGGGSLVGQVFAIDLIYAKDTLTIYFDGPKNNFYSTYEKQ